MAAASVLVVGGACGARSALDVPVSTGGTTGTGGAPLVCPSFDDCPPPPAACLDCVNARVASCLGITDCDPGDGVCDGNLTENHACHVYAAEAVGCLLACDDTHLACSMSYFKSGKGPIFPAGLAFDAYGCSVCGACSAVCSGTPNFATICKSI